jgi:hypothetical protein
MWLGLVEHTAGVEYPGNAHEILTWIGHFLEKNELVSRGMARKKMSEKISEKWDINWFFCMLLTWNLFFKWLKVFDVPSLLNNSLYSWYCSGRKRKFIYILAKLSYSWSDKVSSAINIETKLDFSYNCCSFGVLNNNMNSRLPLPIRHEEDNL